MESNFEHSFIKKKQQPVILVHREDIQIYFHDKLLVFLVKQYIISMWS